MIRASIGRTLLSASAALVVATAMPGPAMAQQHQGTEALYNYYYYSDSTYTEQVGSDRDYCTWSGLRRTATVGTWTPYMQAELYAYCVDGQLAPY